MSTINCQSCRKLDAAAADLRVRLQKAHSALAVFRDPEVPGSYNENAIRDVAALYDLDDLLKSTRPADASGVRILDELRRTREALEVALRVLEFYADENNYAEDTGVTCPGENINKGTVEETWIADGGSRARKALYRITGKELP